MADAISSSPINYSQYSTDVFRGYIPDDEQSEASTDFAGTGQSFNDLVDKHKADQEAILAQTQGYNLQTIQAQGDQQRANIGTQGVEDRETQRQAYDLQFRSQESAQAHDMAYNQQDWNNRMASQTQAENFSLKSQTQAEDHALKYNSQDWDYQMDFNQQDWDNRMISQTQAEQHALDYNAQDWGFALQSQSQAEQHALDFNRQDWGFRADLSAQQHLEGMERDTHQTTERLRIVDDEQAHDLQRLDVQQQQHLERRKDDRTAAMNLFAGNY